MNPSAKQSASDTAAAFVAREAYGRLLAYLTMSWGDLAGAEDALGDAFLAALEHWPEQGVPARPESWLLTVARRKLTDAARHARIGGRPDILAALLAEQAVAEHPDGFPDERIRLMLVCAHPAIDPKIRPALMLQTVLGLDAKSMASAFLLSPETMTKRLVRAKAKIRATGLRFEVPEPSDLRERLHVLLEAIYAAYFLGHEGAVSEGDARDQLRDEAFYLARVIAAALPHDAEALGFLALLAFCEARRPAQLNDTADFVPLLEQHVDHWDPALLKWGYQLIDYAAAQRTLGPFQLEAAIQAAHCSRAYTGRVPWAEIATLYQALVARYPTVGATVGLAVATAHARNDATSGFTILETIAAPTVRDYQPFWVAQWHLHAMRGEPADARRCLVRALSLTTHPRLQRYLRAQCHTC